MYLFLTISTTLVDISSHTGVGILGTNVTLSTQKELDILFGGVKNYIGKNVKMLAINNIKKIVVDSLPEGTRDIVINC
jgi:hypothetical protein